MDDGLGVVGTARHAGRTRTLWRLGQPLAGRGLPLWQPPASVASHDRPDRHPAHLSDMWGGGATGCQRRHEGDGGRHRRAARQCHCDAMSRSNGHARQSRALARLLAQKRGILLDVSLGGTPQPNAVVLSPSGDLQHDPRRLPWPLPDGCVHTAVVTHVLEYLDPTQFFAWWDELWRVVRPHGHVYVSGPYGGDDSVGWVADPAHRVRVVEGSFSFLDPRTPFYARHQPKPWHAQTIARVPGPHGTIGYNVVMERA